MNLMKARPGWDFSRHHERQFGGCSNRAGLHNGSRYTARVALFPQLKNRVCQLTLASLVHQLRGRNRSVGTHAHVERAGTVETESTRGVFELKRTHAEIRQNTGGRRQSAGLVKLC